MSDTGPIEILQLGEGFELQCKHVLEEPDGHYTGYPREKVWKRKFSLHSNHDALDLNDKTMTTMLRWLGQRNDGIAEIAQLAVRQYAESLPKDERKWHPLHPEETVQ